MTSVGKEEQGRLKTTGYQTRRIEKAKCLRRPLCLKVKSAGKCPVQMASIKSFGIARKDISRRGYLQHLKNVSALVSDSSFTMAGETTTSICEVEYSV